VPEAQEVLVDAQDLRRAGAACLLAVVLTLAACRGEPAGLDTTPTPTVATTPASSPTPTPTTSSSASDPAAAQAVGAVVQFWKMLDRLASDSDTSLSDIFTVARGQVADQYIQNITEYRYDNVRQTGRVMVDEATARRLRQAARYQVTACVDVSGTDVVDENGKSVISPTRNPRVLSVYEVERDDGKWYVIAERAIETC
jgi:hypothetical protein